jgi:hypothetical protein
MIIPLLLLLSVDPSTFDQQRHGCLPGNVKAYDIVSAERTRDDRFVTVTVEEKVKQMRGRCSKGRLVDRKGRRIRFYRLHCFGAPTAYALATMKQEREDLDALRKRFTVVEMTCRPDGRPTP